MVPRKISNARVRVLPGMLRKRLTLKKKAFPLELNNTYAV